MLITPPERGNPERTNSSLKADQTLVAKIILPQALGGMLYSSACAPYKLSSPSEDAFGLGSCRWVEEKMKQKS